MNKRIIMLDAGHGGHDSGAVGPGGLKESNVALSVVMLLGSMLTQDFSVLFTRWDDTFVDLSRRAMIANDAGADAFLSVHCNSGPVGSGDGFEVFTTVGQTDSDAFAVDLFTAFASQFPSKRKRMDLNDGDVDKEAGFVVLKQTRMPAALFELEFIHTQAGEAWLAFPGNQAMCARALADGVRKFFGLSATPPAAESIKTQVQTTLRELQTLVDAL